MVEGDLERIIERGEEAEAKIRELETNQRDLEGKVKVNLTCKINEI